MSPCSLLVGLEAFRDGNTHTAVRCFHLGRPPPTHTPKGTAGNVWTHFLIVPAWGLLGAADSLVGRGRGLLVVVLHCTGEALNGTIQLKTPVVSGPATGTHEDRDF